MNNLTRPLIVLSAIALLSPITGAAQTRTAAKPVPPPITNKEILTNASVIELSQLGLSEAVITEKIRQSECRFDTSLNGLKQLKAAKVSDSVIAQMMNPSAKPAPPPTATLTPPPAPKPDPPTATSGLADSEGHPIPLPPDKGAYLWDGKKLTLLIQNPVPSQGQNFWRSGLATFVPLVKRKFEMQLIGGHAKINFAHSRPVIIASGLGEVIPGVPSYRLLYVKTGGMLKDRRVVGEYEVGGFFGSVNRVDNEIPCEVKKISEGIYAIIPQQTLTDGEYGLVPMPKMADMKMDAKSFAAPPVWDFGIYAEGKPQVTK